MKIEKMISKILKDMSTMCRSGLFKESRLAHYLKMSQCNLCEK